jgi:hypothetical protein
MWGPHIGALNVTMNSSSSSVIWSKSGTQGNQWTLREIDINSTTPYNVSLTSSFKEDLSSIAITY